MKPQNKMETMPVKKLVVNVSVPLMISLLVQSLYNIVDSIFVAQISEQALTATSLAFPIQMLMVAVSVGTGLGINSLISRRIGAKDYEAVGNISTTGVLLGVLSSAVFVLFGLFLAPWFFRLYTDDPALMEMGVTYLRICTCFSLGIFVAAIVERMLQSTGKTALSMAALVLNALYNHLVKFKIKGYRPSGKIVGTIYKVGFPSMMVQAMGSLMIMGINNILVAYSATAVAFFGVYYKLQSFVFMPSSGIAQGLIPIVGYNFGAKRPQKITEAIRFAGLLAAIVMAVGTLLFHLIPAQLLSLYNASPEMLAMGVPALRIIYLVFIPTAVVLVIGYDYTGMGNGMVNMIGTLLRQLLPVPIVYVMAKLWGVHSVWYAFWLPNLLALAYALLSIRSTYKKVLVPMAEAAEQAAEANP